MAYEDDVILKNPFDFKISDFIVGSTKKKKVLSKQEQKWWLEFLKKDLYYSKYYDDYVILLGTGMRVSEFCGLTKKNLAFENRTICVDHQILYKKDGSKMTYIATPKTQSGIRYIPMTDAVYKSLKNILKRRIERKTEYMIDGYSGFIIQTQTGKPKNRANIEQMTSRALIRYNKLNPDRQIEYITPHTFRHTFCTNLMEKGIDIKSLQYLMGHSEASTTLDVYSHINYEHVFKQMKKVMNSDENVMSTTP